MTDNDVEAVVERCAAALGEPPCTMSRGQALDVLNALRPGDPLPGGNVVVQGWRPVGSKQKNGLAILGYVPPWTMIAGVWFAEGQWWTAVRDNGRMGCPPPTFYMPLHEPPTPEASDG